MDLNVPTIAQRKAARRSQLNPSDSSTPTLAQQTPATEAPQQDNTASPSILPEPTATHPVSGNSLTPPVHSNSNFDSFPAPHAEVSKNVQLDKDALIALARSMGLELASPKKIWIKHSYSVTPETKQKFSDYCDVLGIKMQDGLEEAFQEWFKKKESEFKAVSDAKNT